LDCAQTAKTTKAKISTRNDLGFQSRFLGRLGSGVWLSASFEKLAIAQWYNGASGARINAQSCHNFFLVFTV